LWVKISPEPGEGPGGEGHPRLQAEARNVELVGQIGGRCYAVAVQGSYAYIGIGPRLAVLDISNPAHPTPVGRTAVLPDLVQDIALAGTLAYVADGEAGLVILRYRPLSEMFLPLLLKPLMKVGSHITRYDGPGGT
jgi:hypothetical protein